MGFTVDENKIKKQKKKKMSGLAKFFITIFSIIIGIPVLLVGVVYGCFYDSSHKDIETKENYSNNDVFNEILVDALDTTEIDHRLALYVADSNINQILKNILDDEKNAKLKEYVKNLYVDTAENKFEMVLEADFYSFFKTRLLISANFKQTNDNGEETLIFTVDNITLGRISGLQKALDFVQRFVTIPDFSTLFEKAGFRLKIDLAKLTMTYKVNDFCEDVMKMAGGQSSSDFMKLFNEIMTSPNFMNVKEINGPKKGSIFSFGLNIDEIKMTNATHGIESYTIPDGYFETQLDYTVTTVKSLLDSGKLTLGDGMTLTQEIDLVAKYIMGGSTLVPSDAEIERLKSEHVFDGVSIPAYNYELPENDKLINVVKSKMPSTIVSEINIDVTSEEINKSLKTTPATGIIASFARNTAEDGEADDYKINYVCTDRIGVVINNNKLFIIINMNLNGYCAHLSLECPRDTSYSEFGKIKFNMGTFRLGDIETSEEVKNAYVSVIDSALSGEGMSGVISSLNNSIIVNLSSIFAEKGITQANADVAFDLVNDASNPTGKINIIATPKGF